MAKPEELEIIAEIIRDEIYSELSSSEMKEWIKGLGWPPNPYVQWFVVEKEKEVIGAMRWEVYDRYKGNVVLMSSWIAIKRGHQNHGIGSFLWEKSRKMISEYWRRKRCKEAVIFTEAEEENLRACAFYRKILGSHLIEVKMSSAWEPKNRIVWFFKEV